VRLQRLDAPPAPASSLRVEELYAADRFLQRPLLNMSAMHSAAGERGFFLTLGKGIWEAWDEQGALCPLVFDGDFPVWRDGVDFRPWSDYEVDVGHGFTEAKPLYSPWQLLPLHDAVRGASAEIALQHVTRQDDRDRLFGSLAPWIDRQLMNWRSLHDRWLPTLKLLIDLQNRFWPAVAGSFTIPFDPELGHNRYDVMEVEAARFDPLALLDRHEIEPEALSQVYEWLVLRGAQIDGGYGPHTAGGDHWGRLRQLADRRERQSIRGPALAALDFYDAAEMLARFWWEMTGRSLPGIEATVKRRSVVSIHQVTVTDPSFARTPQTLRAEVLRHGIWPAGIHAVVEGETEENWVRALLTNFFRAVPEELQITNIHGTGGARQIRPIVEALADYSRHSVLIVDAEGEMARYVASLVAAEVLDPHNIHMVDSSFEEANFTDEELVSVAAHLAANPPGQRPAIELRLSAAQLRDEHDRRVAAAHKGHDPGLAGTLLELVRTPEHGPVNLTKVELADGLIDYAVRELTGEGGREAVERRPIIHFVAERIANPIANETWR
jgi:hypothetical protein